MSVWAIAIHGGAGRKLVSPKDQSILKELHRIVLETSGLLRKGASALDAAEHATYLLEDSGLFNAGRGSCLTAQGTPELEAGICRGEDFATGSVLRVTDYAHPIRLARFILEHTDMVSMHGDRALELMAPPGPAGSARTHHSGEARSLEKAPEGCGRRTVLLAEASSAHPPAGSQEPSVPPAEEDRHRRGRGPRLGGPLRCSELDRGVLAEVAGPHRRFPGLRGRLLCQSGRRRRDNRRGGAYPAEPPVPLRCGTDGGLAGPGRGGGSFPRARTTFRLGQRWSHRGRQRLSDRSMAQHPRDGSRFPHPEDESPRGPCRGSRQTGIVSAEPVATPGLGRVLGQQGLLGEAALAQESGHQVRLQELEQFSVGSCSPAVGEHTVKGFAPGPGLSGERMGSDFEG